MFIIEKHENYYAPKYIPNISPNYPKVIYMHTPSTTQTSRTKSWRKRTDDGKNLRLNRYNFPSRNDRDDNRRREGKGQIFVSRVSLLKKTLGIQNDGKGISCVSRHVIKKDQFLGIGHKLTLTFIVLSPWKKSPSHPLPQKMRWKGW